MSRNFIAVKTRAMMLQPRSDATIKDEATAGGGVAAAAPLVSMLADTERTREIAPFIQILFDLVSDPSLDHIIHWNASKCGCVRLVLSTVWDCVSVARAWREASAPQRAAASVQSSVRAGCVCAGSASKTRSCSRRSCCRACATPSRLTRLSVNCTVRRARRVVSLLRARAERIEDPTSAFVLCRPWRCGVAGYGFSKQRGRSQFTIQHTRQLFKQGVCACHVCVS
jgi:hypothetical protein